MRVIKNEELIAKNRRIATYLFIFSLLVLGSGFIIANGQLIGLDFLANIPAGIYFLLMPLVLLIGFIATIISVRMTNLWVRQPRPEDAIQVNLKGLSNKSAIYHYFHFPARHVLVCPQGVFAIITRFQEGKFTVKGSKWQTKRSIFGVIFAPFRMDSIGNPTREAEDAAKYIRFIVEDYDPDLEVQPLIIFVSPLAEVEIEDPDIPVLFADPKKKPNLKDYLQDLRKAEKMNGPDDLEDFIVEFEAATLNIEGEGDFAQEIEEV